MDSSERELNVGYHAAMIPKGLSRRITFTVALFLYGAVMLNSQEIANTFLLTIFLRHGSDDEAACRAR